MSVKPEIDRMIWIPTENVLSSIDVPIPPPKLRHRKGQNGNVMLGVYMRPVSLVRGGQVTVRYLAEVYTFGRRSLGEDFYYIRLYDPVSPERAERVAFLGKYQTLFGAIRALWWVENAFCQGIPPELLMEMMPLEIKGDMEDPFPEETIPEGGNPSKYSQFFYAAKWSQKIAFVIGNCIDSDSLEYGSLFYSFSDRLLRPLGKFEWGRIVAVRELTDRIAALLETGFFRPGRNIQSMVESVDPDAFANGLIQAARLGTPESDIMSLVNRYFDAYGIGKKTTQIKVFQNNPPVILEQLEDGWMLVVDNTYLIFSQCDPDTVELNHLLLVRTYALAIGVKRFEGSFKLLLSQARQYFGIIQK